MKKKLFIFTLLLALLLSACTPVTLPDAVPVENVQPSASAQPTESPQPPETSAPTESTQPVETVGTTEVHFIDVGQGDSTLIISDGQAMLIDAGTNEKGAVVVSYLKSLGVEKLDYIIGTHPHEDHIGGLDDVINAFDADVVIMPEKQTNTATFESVLDTLIEKDMSITAPIPGTSYTLGSCTFTVLAPLDDYGNNLNNWSVGIILTCGDVTFAFFGDAEAAAEQDILDLKADISADVLKVSHHGSDTSTSQDFLDAIDPAYGVISCGEGNSYGHPCQETLDKLAGVELRRTDLDGTIIATTDGQSISWNTVAAVEGSPSADVTSAEQQTYILNTSSKKFHLPDCASVSKIKDSNRDTFTGDRSQLIAQGYEPCGTCEP